LRRCVAGIEHLKKKNHPALESQLPNQKGNFSMRKLIINFAIAAMMTSLFTAMVATQVGMAVSAARGLSGAPLVAARPALAPNVGANHAVPGARHPRA
jgi:hypothetical protein